MGFSRQLLAEFEKTMYQGRGNFSAGAESAPGSTQKVQLPLTIDTFGNGPIDSPRAFFQPSPSTPKHKGVIIQEILDSDDQQAWADSEEKLRHMELGQPAPMCTDSPNFFYNTGSIKADWTRLLLKFTNHLEKRTPRRAFLYSFRSLSR